MQKAILATVNALGLSQNDKTRLQLADARLFPWSHGPFLRKRQFPVEDKMVRVFPRWLIRQSQPLPAPLGTLALNRPQRGLAIIRPAPGPCKCALSFPISNAWD